MRKFSQVLVALLAAGFMLSLPSAVQAQAKMSLKGQSSHPAASNFHLIFKLWAETVEKMSGGRLKVETLPAGAIVPAFEVFDATSRGVLDVGQAPFGYILGKSLAGIPLSHGPLFGMDGVDYFGWYYDGGGMALLEEFYRDVIKLNLVGFPIPTDYPQGMGWFKKPIKNLADLKGIKYRIYGIGAETYKRLGVSVVTLPGGEIVPALERGVIEGAEWINCLEDKKLGLNNVAKHAYAGHVSVIFEQRAEDLTLIVEDDGRGFDLEAARSRDECLGLVGMRERAQIVGGRLDVETARGKGTSIFVHVPRGVGRRSSRGFAVRSRKKTRGSRV